MHLMSIGELLFAGILAYAFGAKQETRVKVCVVIFFALVLTLLWK